MASNLQMVAPATAPIDIQPAFSVSSGTAPVPPSSSGKALAMAESPVDSGYESSWPSLSEAAAWSPPPGHKRRVGACADLHCSSPPEHGALNSYDAESSLLSQYPSPQPVRHGRHTLGNNSSNSKDSKAQLHPKQTQHESQQHKSRQDKAQRRRARTQAYQAKRMAHLQNMVPLVDFGSPLMEDDDQFYGSDEPAIPLSVIPRGWLYEDATSSSLADDFLIALPKRGWVYDSNNPVSMCAKSFVVMSWNLLSPRLCHPLRLDIGCEPAFLDWNYRKESILNQIAFTDADIICLQELELKDYEEYFNPHLTRLGFRSIHAYKMNVYEMRDGCAIFYRDSRFKLLNEHVLRFNQVELDDNNVKRPSLARDTAIRFNLFHNLAIVALFENRRTKRQVQVATTHLLADPAFPDAKMLQTAILTSKLEELKEAAVKAATLATGAGISGIGPESMHPPQHIPTILAGDFNSLPDSCVVQFLKTGRVDTCYFGGNDFGRFTRAQSKYFYHQLGLEDSYKSSILPFTNATRQFQGTIDYLLYDPSSLGRVGFLDHFEAQPSRWAGTNSSHSQATRSGPASSIASTSSPSCSSSSSNTNMSSSDLDSEMEHDSPPSATLSTRGKKNAKRTTKKISLLDFSKLFESPSTTTPTAKQDPIDSGVIRASLPSALPSQHFPSDHIPLVAVFREREYVPHFSESAALAVATTTS
ncbi:Glucose-repressible alcohol dehydrogenase transcriptional effector [Mortierella sp. GBA30]|nr:Glucose-repressible alcohol dehydrogenase transcriptional effector [Mortierella sp. GBA30]